MSEHRRNNCERGRTFNDHVRSYVVLDRRASPTAKSNVPTLLGVHIGSGIFRSGSKTSPVENVNSVYNSAGRIRSKSLSSCVKQSGAKYTSPSRKSPPYPANKCCGERKIGNDGQVYESKRNFLNMCAWRAHHGCQL